MKTQNALLAPVSKQNAEILPGNVKVATVSTLSTAQLWDIQRRGKKFNLKRSIWL